MHLLGNNKPCKHVWKGHACRGDQVTLCPAPPFCMFSWTAAVGFTHIIYTHIHIALSCDLHCYETALILCTCMACYKYLDENADIRDRKSRHSLVPSTFIQEVYIYIYSVYICINLHLYSVHVSKFLYRTTFLSNPPFPMFVVGSYYPGPLGLILQKHMLRIISWVQLWR